VTGVQTCALPICFSSVGLLALGIGLTMLTRELDLSAVGMYSLAGIIAIKTGSTTPALGVALAVAAGAVAGAVQGALIARLEISSLPLTLGGLIMFTGLTGVLTRDKNVAYERLDVGTWLDQPVATLFSPRSLIALGVLLAAAVVLAATRLGRDLRAVGDDRAASRSAGVRVDRMMIGTFAFSGTVAALGGALLAYSTASAAADASFTPFIVAVTAALLGGVSLAGGHGTVLGVLCGAVALALLQEMFGLLGTQQHVSQLVLGGLLVVVIAVDAPGLRRAAALLRSRLAARSLGSAARAP
jgi:ribose transport system permease protein